MCTSLEFTPKGTNPHPHQKQITFFQPVLTPIKTPHKQTSSSSSAPPSPRSRGTGSTAPTRGRPRVARSFGCTTGTGPSATGRWASAAAARRRTASRRRPGAALGRRRGGRRRAWRPAAGAWWRARRRRRGWRRGVRGRRGCRWSGTLGVWVFGKGRETNLGGLRSYII